MELQHGDSFLENLTNHLQNLLSPSSPKSSVPFQGLGELSSGNAFPEGLNLGGAGDYISSMVRNGVSRADIEEFMRQYQFANEMPGMRPSDSTFSNMLSKLGSGDFKNFAGRVGLSMGAVLPPNLDELGTMVDKLKMQNMGGA